MKEKILKTALIHFANKGYEATSLDSIAKDLNITKPAIYYHYKNKKALYNEIFRHYFSQIEFSEKDSLEENIKEYISKLSQFFQNEYIAKLLAKELACEGEHLEEDTLKTISKTIRFLSKTLQNTDINPFFLQTLIISSFTTYKNTIRLREKVGKIINKDSDFNLTEELTTLILNYIKAHK